MDENYDQPIHAPYYKVPFPLYHSPNQKTLSIVCETEERNIEEILEPTPFEPVANKFTLYVGHFDTEWYSCNDCGVIIPAKFGNFVGGYVAYEYVGSALSLCAGRELWGYPKKLANIEFNRRKDLVIGSVECEGTKLLTIDCELTEKYRDIPPVVTNPHMLLQIIPKAEGPGVFIKRVIARDANFGLKMPSLKEKKFGDAHVVLYKSERDPLYRLSPTKVFGGVYTVGDFVGGWARVLATL